MSKLKIYKNYTILFLTVIVGLGLALVLPWLANAQGRAPGAATPYYVSKSGDGSTGLSWTEAFTNVQDALAAAKDPSEIWVAAGVYYPDIGTGQINDAVTSTFVLTDGVTLYGGFTHGDQQLSDRDWEKNPTVLSGDVDEDDGTDVNKVVTDVFNISGSNAYHVLFAKGVTGTAVVDGFFITAGQAFGPEPDFKGGGFYCDGSGTGNQCSPTFRNVTFSGNQASDGGAMYNYGGQNGNSSPRIHNATFTSNDANDGGAIFNDGMEGESSPIMTHVTFTNNSGSYGGGMFNSGYNGGVSNPKITNAVFIGNFTDDEGGVMYNEGDLGTCIPVLTNVLFSGNVGTFGGALFNTGNFGISSPIITNATFSGNAASSEAGAIYNKGGNGTARADVRNSIFWNNKDKNFTGTITSTFHNANGTITFTHSLVQDSMPGGIWIGGDYVDGGGNIDQDPLFVSPIEPSSAPTTTGNLRLQPGSLAIDTGDNSFIVGFPVDLDGAARITDGDGDLIAVVDMGAYERESFYKFDKFIYLPIKFR